MSRDSNILLLQRGDYMKNYINKTELYRLVSEDTNITIESVAYVCDNLFEKITETMMSGTEVRVHEFGTFGIKKTKDRIARNPRDNIAIEVKSKHLPMVRFTKTYKDKFSENYSGENYGEEVEK